MKKILSLLLVLTLVFALSACGKDKGTSATADTNKSSEQTDNLDKEDKEDVLDANKENSQDTNSDDAEDKSSNTQSLTDATESSNTTTQTSNDSSNTNNNQNNNTTTKPNANTQINAHTHSFSAATCTQPKKCSCGATEGKSLGHKYASATCTKPQTCTCGATNGNALGHNYDIDGVCTRCKTKDPNFTYPSVATMEGRWEKILETNMEEGRCLRKVNFYFDSSGEAGFSIMDYLLEDDWENNFGPLDNEREHIIWNNNHYYLFNGADPTPGGTTYCEVGNQIILTDYKNEQIILQRNSTNTIKVISVEGYYLDYDKLLVNTTLTFYKN